MTVLLDKRVAFDLQASWQARIFAHTKDRMRMVVLSVLAHSYGTSVAALVPEGVRGPFFCTAAKISRRGKIYAGMISADEKSVHHTIVFQTERELQDEFRKLADELKLSDGDRVEMFAAVKRWIVCDYRLDPLTGRKEEKVPA